MFSALLAIIYLAFISLGLPDSLIGAGWPVMHTALHVPVAYAGIVTMIISADTIISSLLSDRLTRRFGAGKVTAVSVLTTALALLGFSVAAQFWQLCLLAIPYGLGAGAVDAALNNFVALHYPSRTMNWLHACWGIGAAISPYVMGFALTHSLGWHSGYRIIGVIQVALTILLFATLPLWRQKEQAARAHASDSQPLTWRELFGLRGVKEVLLAFFAYCAMEQTAALWAASYLVKVRDVSPAAAARFAALYYIGITVGRLLSGLIADRLGDQNMLRLGTGIMLAGIVLILLPVSSALPALAGLVICGLGSGPIYPTIIHETPMNFGAAHSQAVIGVEMAFAYIGTTFMPPLFGFAAGAIGLASYPVFLLVFGLLVLVPTERLNRLTEN
ncbi:MFS transporter [Lacticaseibacillus mingshuiensis]|uniref:MFS transporter n=1 Tax=Lacticaseibacillus mingshuiensis TaxID=2799574 RepID=A0ABW4CJK9_9LACO|nr:MFS transporter [Lacticaseibacillus mingshuiensis]